MAMVPESAVVSPGEWIARHGDVMWRFALARVRDPGIAEEVVQEALADAVAAADSFRGEASEQTWLLSILRRRIADHYRAVGRTVGRAADRNPRAAAGSGGQGTLPAMYDERGKWRYDPGRPPPESVLDSPEFLADFEACLNKLPHPLAEAFVLREVRGQPAAGVCAAAQITLSNLWVRLHRARVLLRKCLSRRWGSDVERAHEPAKKGAS